MLTVHYATEQETVAELRRRLAHRHQGGGYWRVNARAWVRMLCGQLRALRAAK